MMSRVTTAGSIAAKFIGNSLFQTLIPSAFRPRQYLILKLRFRIKCSPRAAERMEEIEERGPAAGDGRRETDSRHARLR